MEQKKFEFRLNSSRTLENGEHLIGQGNFSYSDGRLEWLFKQHGLVPVVLYLGDRARGSETCVLVGFSDRFEKQTRKFSCIVNSTEFEIEVAKVCETLEFYCEFVGDLTDDVKLIIDEQGPVNVDGSLKRLVMFYANYEPWTGEFVEKLVKLAEQQKPFVEMIRKQAFSLEMEKLDGIDGDVS